MNPFDLRGPEFLLFFALCFAGAIGVRIFARRWLGEPQSTQHGYTNPYGIAFLAGGAEAAIRAAVAALFHAGLVEVQDHTVSAVTGSQAALSLAGVRPTGMAVDAFPHAVLQKLRGRRCSQLELESVCRLELQSLRQSLVHAGLLPSDQALRRLRVFDFIGWAVLLMGVIKVGVGLHRDKPVALLVMGLIAGAIVWAITSIRNNDSSQRAKALLRDLQWDHVALKTTAFAQPEQVGPDDIALAYGLFGVLVFGGSLTALREVVFAGDKLWAPPPTPSSGDNGGSHNSCGSSGSSCGGGGGGGCGGCGGGGD